jgi:copper(I)-binding protein
VSANTAGYIKLTNTSDKAITIVAAKSDVAKKTEIHDMKMENGAMSMFQIPELTIKAGETVELRPGGKHIMMMGLNGPLKEGQTVNVTLTMKSGESVSVELPVKRGQKMGMKKGHN